MKQLIARYEGETLVARGDGFYTLVRAVVGQQISVKAADSVWAKLAKVVNPMTPENLLRKRETTLRGCGLSGQKVAYARNVATFFVERGIDTPPPVGGRLGGGRMEPLSPAAPPPQTSPVGGGSYWDALTDEEVIRELTRIKGIGSWTAEMFLMFHLLRPNVLPLKDLGLLKAIDLHFTGGKRLKPAEYEKIAEKWAPYRTVATWYLWRALDPVPVAY